MTTHTFVARRGLMSAVCASILVMAGCSDSPPAPMNAHEHSATFERSVPASAHREIQAELARVRAKLAPYHNRSRSAADYPGPAPAGCWFYSGQGAMGYHYINGALVADPAVDLLNPEVLIYEPGPNGQESLVGLEYIVPLSEPEPAPVLGQRFMRNENLGLWVMHVWLWRQNPDGLFAPWNTNVSCEHAAERTDFAP